ncbi:hypothetical protein ACKWTF_009992 [Chironomus riparius]
MGDSDDEYDRKRRDKFRGERGGGGGERERWPDRERNRSRNEPYYRSARYSPPAKRIRPLDYEERGPRGYGGSPMDYMYPYPSSHDPYANLSPYAMPNPRESHPPPAISDGLSQPAMMSLKQFLVAQDDSISDETAISKYNEYKLEFKRSQLNEFFVGHKDEEWFKLKYHPEMSMKRKEEQIEYLKKRIDVFVELLGKGDVTKVNVDTTNTEALIRLLDTVVIKLEGGCDDDLKVLDEKPIVINTIQPKIVDDKPKSVVDEKAKIEENAENVSDKTQDTPNEEVEESTKSKKRRRTHSDSSSSSDSSSDSDNSDNQKSKNKPEENGNGVEKDDDESKQDVEEKDEVQSLPTEKKDEEMENSSDENKELQESEISEKMSEKIEIDKVEVEVVDLANIDEDEDVKPKKLEELHKTSSIFLRNLAPTITKAEVEALCKRYDGFLRVAIADPVIERRFFRRGWITFKRDVNIKEICWNLNNIRLRDCELAPIVNRDLSRRVRPVNGITAHKTICKNDIKICAKIAHSLDEKYGLWLDRIDESDEKDKSTFGLQSKNPVLKNITDYLIEEANAEEEELLGLSSESKENNDGEFLERDLEYISVLDKIILYLRIVHSVDFYNHCEYPYEDEMPNRCGIIHARGPPPQNKITSNETADYIKNFENKISQFLASTIDIPLEELKKLGAKDIDMEVEKFITANTQELAKDKWLCPLSGKKFKGPDYVRKHILSKHAEKVEEVKKEVEYYNNYLKDSKRPQLPEHPANNAKKETPMNAPMFRQPQYAAPMPYNPYPYASPMMGGRGHGRGFSRGARMDNAQRPLIHYRDLDAPAGMDELF